MMTATALAIAEATGGTLIAGREEQIARGAETDSRQCRLGTLFVPLIAARDGHDFIDAAFANGAAGTLCSRLPEHFAPGKFYIRVADTGKAYQALASWYRAQFAIPFIQITGSVGKTTTKEMIAAVLAEHEKVLWTEGNYNNGIGVPKTLLRLGPEHRAAVIETGMNHFGEISELGSMVRPDVAVITNVGDAHIENLGSREGILEAKCEIFEHLSPDGFAVLNGDDELLNTVIPAVPVYRCGEGPGCGVRVEQVEDLGIEGVKCVVATEQERYPLFIPAPGRHMIYCAAMAAIIGEKLGLSPEEIIAGVAHYEPAGERMRVIHRADGALILSDCYNANPQSMAAAIETLARSGRAHTAAVLGDMGELGERSPEMHYGVGKRCADADIGAVIAIGEKAAEIARGAREGGCASVQWFPDRAAALEAVLALAGPETAVLVKASHAMEFPKLAARLAEG